MCMYVCVCVCVCTCVCVCVCVCVTSSRWRRGGHTVAGEQQFRGDSARKWRACSWWVELYAYKAHFGASNAAPRRQRAPLLSWLRIRFHRSPATFTLRWTPPANTNLSPHPLGSLELAVRPYRHHGHQWLRRTVRSTWLALTAIFTAKVRSSHSPGLSGVGLASPPI